MRFYEDTIQAAIELQEVAPDADVRRLAFELEAPTRLAGSNARTFDEQTMYGVARRAMLGAFPGAETGLSGLDERG